MSLTRASFNTIKRMFAAGLDDAGRTAYTRMPLDEQIAKLRQLVTSDLASDGDLARFILVLHVRSKLVAAGTPEHFALRESLGIAPVKPWHKPRPPKTMWELQDSNRVPSWIEDAQAAGAIARTITWEDLRGGADLLAAAVRVFFKFGGMEDLGDPRAVQADDPTMRLFVDGLGYSLATCRPEWHDGNGAPLKELPAGVDGRSQDEIEQERERTEKIRRNEEARERTRVRREQDLTEYGELRGVALTKFRSERTAVIAHDISRLEFEDAKTSHEATIRDFLQESVSAVFDLISLAVTLPEGAGADEVAELRKETTERALALVVQVVLEDVNEHQSGWFRRLSNGDFRFRPQPLKGEARPAGYVSKKEKAAARAISKIYTDYGEDVLNFALLAIVGQKLAGPALATKAPDWLKFKGGEEEIVVTGIPEAPATLLLPPPPPAPGAPLPPPPPAPRSSLLG